MKKILSIVLGVVLTLGAIALTSSCRKDIDNAQSLVGSYWLCQDGLDTYELTFPSATEFKVVEIGNNWVATGMFIITGNKTSLKDSHITLTLGIGQKWIDGDSMPLTGKFESESKINFEAEDVIFIRSIK